MEVWKQELPENRGGKRMKKEKIFKASGLTMATVAICSMTMMPAMAASESTNGTSETSSDNSIVSTSVTPSDEGTEKNETVYVFSDANGTVSNIEVRDALENVGDITSLLDESELTDIENVEGDEEFTNNDGELIWEADGESIYYKGNTDKEVPVKIKVSYYLNGEKVSPEEIAGKSGKVKIRFDYENTTSNSSGVSTPFLALTGFVMDNDNFSDVEVTNAKAVDDGDRTIIVGMAFPGLQEDLGVSSDVIDVPDYFEVEADASDFKIDSTISLITTEVFDEFDFDEISSDDLDSAVDQLTSAMDQLMEGSTELQDGLLQLESGSAELAEGLDTLSSKTSSLPSSANQLSDGANSLADGLDTAETGSVQLTGATKTLYDGLMVLKYGTDVESGLADALTGIGSSSDTGTSTVYGGLNNIQYAVQLLENGGTKPDGTHTDGLPGAKSGVDSVKTGIDSAITAINYQILPGLKGSSGQSVYEGVDGAKQYVDGVNSALGQSASSIGTAIQTISTYNEKLSNDSTTLSTDVATASTALDNIDTSGMTAEQIEAINTAKSSLESVETDTTNVTTDATYINSAASGLSQLSSGLSSAQTNLDTASTILSNTENGIDQVYNGLDTVTNGGTLSDGTTTTGLSGASAGLSQISSGIAEAITTLGTVDSGITSVEQALDIIVNGTDDASITGKTSKGLKGAVAALGDDSDQSTLIGGAKAINTGASSLSSGISDASDGADQLADGLSQLKSAVPTLVSGIAKLDEGAHTLADGTESAYEGSEQLADGIEQFDEEGVQKLVDYYQDDIKGLVDNLNSIVDAGKSYTNFSGISEGAKGTVKFIYKTDAVEASDDSTSSSPTTEQ
jgi:putative membrane protein